MMPWTEAIIEEARLMTDSHVSIGGPVPILLTEDMPETIEYYCETLGFEVANAMPPDEPTWCFLRRGDAGVMFIETHEHGEDEDHEHAHDHGDAHDHDADHPDPSGMNRLWSLYFYPDDVDALWEKMRGKATVVCPPENMDYGMREFTIRDPNGYALNFGRPIDD